MNDRRLLEALVGYGEWGDGDFEDTHDFKTELINTLVYKADELSEIYDAQNDKELIEIVRQHLYTIGDVINFLKEFKEQSKPIKE